MADRAVGAVGVQAGGVQRDAAFAMSAVMVFAFLGVELDGVGYFAATERGGQSGPGQRAWKGGQLTAQALGGMGVGKGDYSAGAQLRHSPVHCGVGGKPAFDGGDLRGQVAEAIGEGVKTAFGAIEAVPGRPGVGGDDDGFRVGFQGQGGQVMGRKGYGGTAVVSQIAVAGQPTGKGGGGVESGDDNE